MVVPPVLLGSSSGSLSSIVVCFVVASSCAEEDNVCVLGFYGLGLIRLLGLVCGLHLGGNFVTAVG